MKQAVKTSCTGTYTFKCSHFNSIINFWMSYTSDTKSCIQKVELGTFTTNNFSLHVIFDMASSSSIFIIHCIISVLIMRILSTCPIQWRVEDKTMSCTLVIIYFFTWASIYPVNNKEPTTRRMVPIENSTVAKRMAL